MYFVWKVCSPDNFQMHVVYYMGPAISLCVVHKTLSSISVVWIVVKGLLLGLHCRYVGGLLFLPNGKQGSTTIEPI